MPLKSPKNHFPHGARIFSLEKIAWIFVCQSGRLEREASVLAASLRKTLGPQAKLVAAIPQPATVFGNVAQPTLEFLESVDVKIVPFNNDLIGPGDLRGANDPDRTKWMMNKAFALETDHDAEINVFLDSDQVCFSQPDLRDLSVPMLGRKVFYPGAVSMKDRWQRAYEVCETPMPQHRLVVRSRDPNDPPLVTPPCFISGLISVHRAWVHGLASSYVECFKRLASFETHRAIVAECVRIFSGLREILAGDTRWQSVIDS